MTYNVFGGTLNPTLLLLLLCAHFYIQLCNHDKLVFAKLESLVIKLELKYKER